MGEATKKDGLATEPATVDPSHDLSTSPDASRHITGNPPIPVVTLEECEWTNKKFVETYEEKPWPYHNDALKAIREISEHSGRPLVQKVYLFHEQDPRHVPAIDQSSRRPVV